MPPIGSPVSPRRSRRARFEQLEPRNLLTVFEVTHLGRFGDGSLAAALDEANFSEGPDTVQFREDLVGNILFNGDFGFEIRDSVTIIGPGPDRVTIDARRQLSVFYIADDLNVTIRGLTIANGSGGASDGGAIFVNSDSTLTLEDVVISGSQAAQKGGAIYGDSDTTVNLVRTVVHSSEIDSSKFVEGGAIFASTVHLTDSRVHDNHVLGGQGAKGGGIAATTVTLVRSTVSSNTASTTAVKNEDVTAAGGGISAAQITAIDSSITGNALSMLLEARSLPSEIIGGGGGLYAESITLERSVVADNWTDGLRLRGGGAAANSITAIQSTIEKNSTKGDSSSGGGLWARDSLIVDRSTVSGNVTLGSRSDGGGLANATQVLSSTISGNSAGGGVGRGGGVYQPAAPLLIAFSTVTDNKADGFGEGGGVWTYSGTLRLVSSIVAGNLDGGGKADLRANAGGIVATRSIIGNAWGTSLLAAATRDGAGNLIGLPTSRGGPGVIDAGLTPLAYRGGLTATHGLKPNSQAINFGGAQGSTVALPANDQRDSGFPRGLSATSGGAGAVDVGAFELSLADAAAFADANGDGSIGAADLSSFRSRFGQRGTLPGDADLDSDVDGNDLLLLQRVIGASRPEPPAPLSTALALPKSLWLSLPAAAPGVQQYRLEMLTGSTWSEIGRLPASARRVWVDGLEAGASYQFRLLAANALGVSNATAFQTTTPNTTPTAESRVERVGRSRSTPIFLPASDPDGHALTASVGAPLHGTLTPGSTSLGFVYTPTPGYLGYDQFVYSVDDGRGGRASATLTLKVSGHAEITLLSRRYAAFTASNGQYVAAEGGGGGAVNANRNAMGLWEQYEVRPEFGDVDYVRLLTGNRSALELTPGGETIVAGSSGTRFEVFGLDDDFQIALLAPNGKFVQAVNGGGGSLQASATAVGSWEAFRIDTAVPAPVNLRVVGLESSFADIQFDNIAIGSPEFFAEYQPAGAATWTVINLSPASRTNFRLVGLAERTSYNVRVSTLRNGLSSPTALSFTTLQTAVAQAPQLQSPNNITTSSRFPTFQWGNVANADSYIFHLYEGDSSSEVVDQRATITPGAGVTTHTITGEPLRANRDYWWSVEGSNSRGAGPLALPKFKFHTPETVDIAPVPTRPAQGDMSVSTTPLFVWQNVGPATKYRLRIYQGAADSTAVRDYTNIAEIAGGETSFRIPDADHLEYETNYWWEVRGINDEGPGPFSDKYSWSFRTWEAEIENFPSLRTPNDNATNVSRGLQLRWDNLGRATSYHWYLWRDDPNTEHVRDGFVDEDPDGVSQVSFASDPLASRRDYWWAVRGINSRGPGPLSPKRKFTTGTSTSITAADAANLAGAFDQLGSSFDASEVGASLVMGGSSSAKPAPSLDGAGASLSALAPAPSPQGKNVRQTGELVDARRREAALDAAWSELDVAVELRRGFRAALRPER